MTYKGEPANSLSLLELVVFNDGTSPIERIELQIALPAKARILEINTPLGDRDPFPAGSVKKSSENTIHVSATSLNPWADHHEKLLIRIMCESDSKPIRCTGRGSGWSAETKAIEESVGGWPVSVLILGALPATVIALAALSYFKSSIESLGRFWTASISIVVMIGPMALVMGTLFLMLQSKTQYIRQLRASD